MKLEQRYSQNALNEMFSQRLQQPLVQLSNYQKHIKKLEELTNRRSYRIQSDRVNQLDALKTRKHHSFLREMLERNNDISRENGKIFDKLSTTKDALPLAAHAFSETVKQPAQLTPFRRRQIMDTHRENLRMSVKLKSLISSINTRKIEAEYSKASEIRNRISRYESNPNSQKKLPKSQKFLNVSMSRSIRSLKSARPESQGQGKKESSTASHLHSVKQPLPLKTRTFMDENRLGKKSTENKPRLNSFYKREDIIKNRVAYNQTASLYRKRMLENYQLNRSVNVPAEPTKQSPGERSRSRSHSKDPSQDNFFTTQLPKRPARPKK